MGTESMLFLDHDPLWVAAPTQEYLQDNSDGHFPPEETPAKSPDTTIIEDTWAMMAKAVHDKNPTTKAKLRDAILSSWTECTTPEKLAPLYASMPKRMQAILEAHGGMTKY